jgi:Kef-type K+ transport system membrane component KefB
MNRKWGLVFYIAMFLIFGTAIYQILQRGRLQERIVLHNIPAIGIEAAHGSSLNFFTDSFSLNFSHPLPILLLQILIIITIVRLFGFIFNKIGQQTVVGEIVAGIALGPSVMGFFFPGAFNFIFPASSFANIQFLSQVGLILFMFVIGMELDSSLIRKQAQQALIISHASIIIPCALGVFFALFLYRQFAPAKISFSSFALFMGIAMSITAFPVLARIIQERGLTRTKLGVMAITCAAADDITAWCLLAALVAIVKAGSPMSAFFTLGLVMTYLLIMLFAIRPLLNKLSVINNKKEMINNTMMAIVFMVLLLSSFGTEVIGIHALFGAFVAGIIMPQGMNFRKIVINKIEDVSLVLLLPLFFVFTGLRTHLGLLLHGHLWMVCGGLILIAVAGKFGGSTIAAKAVGQSWKDSLSIGALMNTRGLMELIVLNVGFDLGILNAEIFTMMVIMALVTTLMTSPALNFINWLFAEKK